jgi:hypothetical protein
MHAKDKQTASKELSNAPIDSDQPIGAEKPSPAQILVHTKKQTNAIGTPTPRKSGRAVVTPKSKDIEDIGSFSTKITSFPGFGLPATTLQRTPTSRLTAIREMRSPSQIRDELFQSPRFGGKIATISESLEQKIAIAVRLGTHVGEGVTEVERHSRLEEALATMQRELEDSRLLVKTLLEKKEVISVDSPSVPPAPTREIITLHDSVQPPSPQKSKQFPSVAVGGGGIGRPQTILVPSSSHSHTATRALKALEVSSQALSVDRPKSTKQPEAQEPRSSIDRRDLEDRDALVLAQTEIIAKAKARLQALSHRPKRVKRTAHQQELYIAKLEGDKELLEKGSDRCKKEERSDEDEAEVAKEVAPGLAAHNLFNPRKRVSVYTKELYVRNGFIAPSSSEEEDEEHSEEEDDENIEEEDGYNDDDPSSDYAPSPTTAEAERLELETLRKEKALRSVPIPTADFLELQALRKEKAAREFVTLAPSSAPSISHADQLELAEHRRRPPSSADNIPALLSAILEAKQTIAEKDQHGRVKRDLLPLMDVAMHPPVHGKWNDVDHLMKVYMPAYDRYRASCGLAHFNSIWDGYSFSQKTRIAKLLSKTANGVVVEAVTIADLDALTNDEFKARMCKEKGHNTTTLTEIALRAIKFTGLITAKCSWINFESDWQECLEQASANGHIDNKRLLVLYREAIPDTFFQSHILSKRFDNWMQCHQHMVEQLRNPDFLIPWDADKETRKPPPVTPATSQASPAKQKQQEHKHTSGGAAAVEIKAPSTTHGKDFDPLTYRNSYGTLNVNPNLIVDLDHNKSKAPCTRCDDGTIHRWGSDLCTTYKNKSGAEVTPKISSDENTKRAIVKWDVGFFAAKDPRSRPAPRQSPSVQDTAAAAAGSSARLKAP